MEKMSARFEMRCDESFAQKVNDWRRMHDDPPNKSEAVRQLVEMGLKYENALDLLRELIEGASLEKLKRNYSEIFEDLNR